jgi:hypothetical protein
MPLTQARRVEGAAGVLASVYGLIAVGVVSFAPQVSFFVSRTGVDIIRQASWWSQVQKDLLVYTMPTEAKVTAVGAWLLCMLCLIAIGAGAYAHAVKQMAGGRRWLVLGTAVLTVELTFALGTPTFGYAVALSLLNIMVPFASPLLPALVVAALACGVAVTP